MDSSAPNADSPISVVTGSSSGIGRAIATALSHRGHHVAIVGRDQPRLDALAAELPGPVDVYRADLSLMGEVREYSDHLHATFGKVDVLVNNAGVQYLTPQSTADGLDAMVAINYFAPFLLTNLVRDLLDNASGGARVVTTASEAHRWAPRRIDLSRLGQPFHHNKVGGYAHYGLSKLFDILFTSELARRVDPAQVTANCFCPGAVDTTLVYQGSRAVEAANKALVRTPLVRTPEQGAQMAIRLATEDRFADVTGQFFSSSPVLRIPLKLAPAVPARSNVDLQQQLWDRTADLVGLPVQSA